MKIGGAVALATGANRGLGQAYARELLGRGASRVYGAARDLLAVAESGITPIALDITGHQGRRRHRTIRICSRGAFG